MRWFGRAALTAGLAAALAITGAAPALASPGTGASAPAAGDAAPKSPEAPEARHAKKDRPKPSPKKASKKKASKKKARRKRGGEKRVEEAGKGVEKSGKGVEKSGKGVEKSGKGVAEAGKGVEKSGKGVAEAGKGVAETGKARKAGGGKAEKGKKKVAARTSRGTRRVGKARKAHKTPPKPCLGPTLQIDRVGLEADRIMLVDCKQRPREEARKQLSILSRPWGAPRPSAIDDAIPASAEARKGQREKKNAVAAGEVAPGVRLLDPGLLVRLDALARRYPDRPISLVSGYRPQSRGSLHQSARALDLRIQGVPNDQLVAACRTLPDTGCGYYPNSSFIHMDVRAPGTGTVSWIDASGPGEPPRYVSAWPPPAEEAPAQKGQKAETKEPAPEPPEAAQQEEEPAQKAAQEPAQQDEEPAPAPEARR